MRYSLVLLLFVFALPNAVWSQKLSIGQWYTHLPHGNARQVVDTGEEIFALTNVYFFSYDKSIGGIERYDKVAGLSDVQVDHLAYSEDEKVLVVAYRNTNIDIIKDGNTIINVSDIFRKSISGIKEINRVVILDSTVYFATTFGIAVFDIENEEFRDTYIIGDDGAQVSVVDVAFTTDSIFALTVDGLKKAPRTGANLANYQNWQTIGAVNGLPLANGTQLEMVDNSIFALFGDTVYKGVNGNWTFHYGDTLYRVNSIKSTDGKLLVLTNDSAFAGRISYVDSVGVWQHITGFWLSVPLDATWDEDGVLWVADLYSGLLKKEGTEFTPIKPNGPASFTITDMSYKDGVLWVAPGGADASWNYNYNESGFLRLVDGFWGQYSRYDLPALSDVPNIFTVATSPITDKVYFGSYWNGVVIWDGNTLTKFNKDNTGGVLEGTSGDTQRTRISSVELDEDGNLWVANYGATTPLVTYTTDGQWLNMATPPLGSGNVGPLIIDDYNQKWLIVLNQGILVYNHGADLLSTADDDYKLLNSTKGNGALPSNEVVSLANDKQGQVWVGTSQGIAIFYCAGSVLTQGCDAQRIIVSRDGFNGYLLETERINNILVDGADRKWVATNNGVWVFSPDGTEELAYYNEENSPLISDNVRALGYDGEHGIIYISTDKGLMSLRTEATEAGTTYLDPIEVFPNPVKETYSGTIAIRGLPANAEVHITDVTGMLIYQTQAFGGQAVWDGRDYTGRKAKTGVYLVFSVNEDGTESKPTKLLLIK